MPGLSSKPLVSMNFVYGLPPERFVYQIVVPKSLAPRDLVQVLEFDEKVVLPPWDPMVRDCCSVSLLAFNNEFIRALLHDVLVVGRAVICPWWTIAGKYR
jgi:hypothetical protein